MKFALTLILLLINAPLWAIVNGIPINSPLYRQSVAITYKSDPFNNDSEIYCSGTLIGPKVVITAAHCILSGAKAFKVPVEEFKKNTWIYVGETSNARDLPMIYSQIPVSRIELRPQNDAISSDIALIELADEIDLSQWKIVPAPILIPTEKMKGLDLIHVGYGQITNGGVKGNKAWFKLPINEVNDYNGVGVGDESTDGPGACHGDSGGSGYIIDQQKKMHFIGVEYAISKHPCGRNETYFVPLTEKMLTWIQSFNYKLFLFP